MAPKRLPQEEEMRIAILGWGSLLWEGGAEFDKWHDPWEYDGPTLKLEFSRISDSRLGALTLVIDEDHGTPTCVAYCLSKRANLDDAVCDLRSREDTTAEKIGRLVVTPKVAVSTESEPESRILAWARQKRIDRVVWTALKTNFEEKTRKQFSVAAVVAYVKALDPGGKTKAAEYVWRAPTFVKTGVRSALQKEPWFSEEAR
jgi:hypothetical protein